uniref:Uncharacterized protein LOC112836043 n=1 Tax=Callorhinus ursinus TaxID=34884 RepID=A0A3Q7Q9W5_CALUR|nr:uncharacterized protein LOC112836043 [Callorhinus ursinus]
MATDCGRSRQIVGNLEVRSRAEEEGERRHGEFHQVLLKHNLHPLFIYQFHETSQELNAVSLQIYNRLILNPNRLKPNQIQILKFDFSPIQLTSDTKNKDDVYRLAVEFIFVNFYSKEKKSVMAKTIIPHVGQFLYDSLMSYFKLLTPQKATMCTHCTCSWTPPRTFHNVFQSVSRRTLFLFQEPNSSAVSCT